ncbi:hypothetical protein DFH08DRAFT_390918 [Mycena albidolilacea]|uniref:Uncharacterized protein n=1 Tax=Mycena albidolilacea TaxID=1033008 RepID=A0AAD6ZEL5_9AGAR|nr:hypothetical protein DFH08DRAFT_390918 [Mycena albidolilacea]
MVSIPLLSLLMQIQLFIEPGIYLVLFCICIYILLHRPRNLANIILLVTAISLFTLSTIQTIINIILGAADVDNINIPYDQLFYADNMIYVANSGIADGLFIYRCYIIWNRNIYVVILPIIMLVITVVFGVDQALPLAPFFGITLATTVLVAALTAGRIWWIGRQTRAHLKPDVQRRYSNSISVIVESGVIYSVGLLAYLILGAIPSTLVAQDPTVDMLAQLVGIVPTLVIVRVGLGLSLQSESTVSGSAVLNSDVYSRSRPRFVGKAPYDIEKSITSPVPYGTGRPQGF